MSLTYKNFRRIYFLRKLFIINWIGNLRAVGDLPHGCCPHYTNAYNGRGKPLPYNTPKLKAVVSESNVLK